MKSKPGPNYGVLKETAKEWQEDNAMRVAPALAYYTVFSSPLMLAAISVGGLVFGHEAATSKIYHQLNSVVGLRVAAADKPAAGYGAACLESIVPPDFEVVLPCDGCSANNSFIKARAAARPPIRRAGGLAHVRRKFFENQPDGEDAKWILLEIQKLYRMPS